MRGTRLESGGELNVTNPIAELAGQMEQINRTIAQGLSSPRSVSQPSLPNQCPQCADTSSVLMQLQAEVQLAIKQVEIIRQQQSTIGNNVTKKGSSPNNMIVSSRKMNAKQDQVSGMSFREMLHRKRMNNEKSVQSTDANTTGSGSSSHKVESLDELILSCAPYLTGSPVEYTSWLRSELDVQNITDLAKVVEDRPGILVAGNGSVGMWQKQKFCDAVRIAASAETSGDTSG